MRDRTDPPPPLAPAQWLQLASALKETPETTVPVGLLRSGRALAYVVGQVGRFEAATVQAQWQPATCWSFGANVVALANLLVHLDTWENINVRPAIAAALGQMMHARTGRPFLPYDDLCHTLTHPVRRRDDPLVRVLTVADLPLLAAAPLEMRGPDPAALLRRRVAAGAIVNEQLVSLAQAYAFTPRYADIVVYTMPRWRARGWATAAAGHVAAVIQHGERIPVLRIGLENEPARRIAARLGFREAGRRTMLRPA